MAKKICPKCEGSMTEGFLIDKGHGGSRSVSSWLEGVPERSFWMGIKLRGRAPLEVATWRCDRCGFLESYA